MGRKEETEEDTNDDQELVIEYADDLKRIKKGEEEFVWDETEKELEDDSYITLISDYYISDKLDSQTDQSFHSFN